MKIRLFRAVAPATLVLCALVAGAPPCSAKVFLTQAEALKLAFPDDPEPGRTTAYLSQEQADRVRQLSGEDLPAKVITYYTGAPGKAGVRTAWFDTHLVRTMPETVMVVVSATGVIERVDILSFDEPNEYLPRPGWTGQFAGRSLDAQLSARQGIHPISGATLTARAIVAASRRVLAMRQVLVAAGQAGP